MVTQTENHIKHTFPLSRFPTFPLVYPVRSKTPEASASPMARTSNGTHFPTSKGLPSTIFRRNGAGFTLLELMVVVVIIGIMIGVAIPKFASHRKRTSVKLAARSAVSVARLARSRAMAERKYHLAIFNSTPDSEGRCHIWVQKDETYTSKNPVFGTEKVLPKGVVIDSTSSVLPKIVDEETIYYYQYTPRGTSPSLSKKLRLWDGTGNEHSVYLYGVTGEAHIEDRWR